jgi:adenine-specific DNA-methyltransferase
MSKTGKGAIEVEALIHDEATRRNIPTAEFESLMREEDKSPVGIAYARRNRDLDPQLVWRGKDEQDWSDLVVQAPPLYIQEKVQPKVLIDDLRRESHERAREKEPPARDLFSDFNGPYNLDARTEFYQHDLSWSNRMILGDALSVMASLAEREALRGRVQCIYIDPPYGIRFNSNFQWSTTTRDVRDGASDHIPREPEQVRAFRDTWRDGIHSYLTYLRDRLTVARDLLSESGSIFVQISDENLHRVRLLMDEVFGPENFAALITFRKKMMPLGSDFAESVSDYLLWYTRNKAAAKTRPLFQVKKAEGESEWSYAILPDGRRHKLSKQQGESHGHLPEGAAVYQAISLLPAQYRKNQDFTFDFEGTTWSPPKKNSWKTDAQGMRRLLLANRLHPSGTTLRYVLRHGDYPVSRITNLWADSSGATQQVYVVQTNVDVVKRCILMSTDPGDLVLDPTCGSGTTAYVAEQWGRRWITIDTSRVALALARSRIMGARFAYYLLADSPEGQAKEAQVTRSLPRTAPTRRKVSLGFVYERVPHVTLGSIANNTELDLIWEKWQVQLEAPRAALNDALGENWQEWQIPAEAGVDWPKAAREAHAQWWEARTARQREIDNSITSKAEFEYLYDKPYIDNSRVRVAGPFTVESMSPHRVLIGDSDEQVSSSVAAPRPRYRHDGSGTPEDFAAMILENLKASGVQQMHKQDRITFTTLTGWPGKYICALGKFMEGEQERSAGILIGPEFGTVSRPDLVVAAREAGEAGFHMLIACAFNYDAHSADFSKLGRISVLKARMNPDLHMGDDLKAGSGNLFVVFGEPDIDIEQLPDGMIRVRIKGIDIFKPQSGDIESGGPDTIALWMIDTDYNEESFFVRHAYFLGANDPYKALKMTLKDEIDAEAWASLNSDVSRQFPRPASGRIAVKVINHLGDEVMKVFSV